VDAGALGSATGHDLMAHGIDIDQSPKSAAPIVIVTVR
jgi:hypothetical protein